jgi:hypothetical protein
LLREKPGVTEAILRPLIAALAAAAWLAPAIGRAGPPYVTDDPEPVKYRHWEFYLATEHSIAPDAASGTAPHVEVNYGVFPDIQLHLLAPLAYARPRGGPTTYGPGDIEVGGKIRFADEGDWWPMVGTFPQFELPLGSAARRLGTGQLQVFIPLWLQKSFGRWTTYGGGGFWVNPGEGNRNYWYVGWLLQRRLSELATIGAEVFYTTRDHVGGSDNLRFNLGLVLDFTENHHLLLSAGRGVVGNVLFQGYAGYQLTI